jgi:hypothetical protein
VVVVTDDPSDQVVVDRDPPSDVRSLVYVDDDDDCASAGAIPTTALIRKAETNFISLSKILCALRSEDRGIIIACRS